MHDQSDQLYRGVKGFANFAQSQSAGLGCSIRRFGYGFPVHVQTELDRDPQFDGHRAPESAARSQARGSAVPQRLSKSTLSTRSELLIPGLDVWAGRVDVPITRPRAVTL